MNVTAEAKRRVLAALEDIEKLDTDRTFILAARSRYCDITQPHHDEAEPKRCDAGAGIVMSHSNIRTGT